MLKLLCKHCGHEEHLRTKCYNDDCKCIECFTIDDLKKTRTDDNLDITALFNGA